MIGEAWPVVAAFVLGLLGGGLLLGRRNENRAYLKGCRDGANQATRASEQLHGTEHEAVDAQSKEGK